MKSSRSLPALKMPPLPRIRIGAHGRVALRFDQRVGHRLIHRGRDRVLLVGPVEGNRQHAVGALDQNVHCHLLVSWLNEKRFASLAACEPFAVLMGAACESIADLGDMLTDAR